MQIKKLATTCFVISSFLGTVMAYAEDADSDRSHPMTFVKDSAITVKVKAKLADQHMKSLAHVHVDTDAAGAVQLSGTVRTQSDMDKAVELAKGTEGVTSVSNKLHVRKH